MNTFFGQINQLFNKNYTILESRTPWPEFVRWIFNKWVFKLPFWVKLFSHILHIKGFSPVCTLRWFSKEPKVGHFFPQNSQTWTDDSNLIFAFFLAWRFPEELGYVGSFLISTVSGWFPEFSKLLPGTKNYLINSFFIFLKLIDIGRAGLPISHT